MLSSVFAAVVKAGMDYRVSVPSALLVGLVILAFKAGDVTVEYLSQFFLPRAEAQTLTSKVEALQQKVDGLSKKIDENRIAVLERETFRLRIEQCMATGALRTLYADQLASLLTEWRNLTNRPSSYPSTYVSCDDIG